MPARWTLRLPISIKEEDVEASQPDRLDGEEVTGQDQVCMLAARTPSGSVHHAEEQKECGAGSGSWRRPCWRSESRACEPPLDAAVGPPGILACQAKDQVAKLRVAKLAGPTRVAAIGGPICGE